MGHSKVDIIACLYQAVADNYLNNVGKGKKILSPVVFQGGVSKNTGVVEALKKALKCDIIVDNNGHLMGLWESQSLPEKVLCANLLTSLSKIWFLKHEKSTVENAPITVKSSVFTEMED